MLIIVTFKVNGCMDNLATLKINYLAGKLKIKNMSIDDCHSVMSVFGVILVCIFPHSDCIRRNKGYLSVFTPNARKYGLE